ncbi:anti-anti-sigma factor [Amycolatopsis pretoriensis]|uniref:Anti-sigma factor antagonist n=1 Tax=Amycolatopsis pretoriensis TaxID=218821 RepID=A0A1H5RFH9_9PSEU|nr:STAS domain-containing protein [Amycolatopsis pretoriensis]SEF37156.1 anti-anti-sigma factor [Amycolatopsis pretoriensis]
MADGNPVRPQDLLRVTVLRPADLAGSTVLEVSGEVDLHSASVLDDAISGALADDPALLIIDLTAVTFLASIGITALINARRTASFGTSVRVVTPDRSVVARALELTGLREVLAVVPLRADAFSR